LTSLNIFFHSAVVLRLSGKIVTPPIMAQTKNFSVKY
jgi:hypothetical protein